MTYSRQAAAALAFLVLLAVPLAAGEELRLFVNSRAFDVSVAPVDEESKNADSSILYQRTAPDKEWDELGECKKISLPNGEIRFTREVDVETDGVFQYTSRPVVGGKVALPPKRDSQAQAVVIVDTLAPTAEITAPETGVETKPGQTHRISWVVSDENLRDKPAALSYSTDGGKSWTQIEAGLPAEGEREWTAPADLPGPATLRLAAADRAGNTGRDTRTLPKRQQEATGTPERTAVIPVEVLEKGGGLGELEDIPQRLRDPNRSWLYYLMAVNLMRQNKPADALQYYWLSVKEDPEFINAWADIALAYIDLGAYRTAREIVEQTRERAPERIDLHHLMGETFHAEGMEALATARTAEERMQAKGLIDQAVAWYGTALERAAEDWRLAEQAASFYRLGEICYYVNMDRDGARAYWKKILSLHAPNPNYDLLLWSSSKDKPAERKRHERYTYQRVSLDAWQNWARGYIEQMDARERAGILDLMPAQKITAKARSLSYAGNDLNPGRDDGRSLFSLPTHLGSPENVAASVGVAGQPSCPDRYANTVEFPMQTPSEALTEGYSFYGEKERPSDARQPAPVRRRRGQGMFSGREERAYVPPDPYAFPQRGRGRAAWNNAQPYGNQPVQDW